VKREETVLPRVIVIIAKAKDRQAVVRHSKDFLWWLQGTCCSLDA